MPPGTHPARDEPREAQARGHRSALEERAVDGALSASDAAELERWRRFEAAAQALRRRAESREGFAAAPIRYAGGGTVWLGFAADPAVALSETVGDFPWPDRVRTYRAARSLGELKALRQTIESLRDDLARRGVRLSMLGVDEDANAVRMLVPTSHVERAAHELRRFGEAVRVEGGYVRRLGPVAQVAPLEDGATWVPSGVMERRVRDAQADPALAAELRELLPDTIDEQ